MKKLILRTAAFVFVLFVFVGCSSEKEKSFTKELTSKFKADEKYGYKNENGIYNLSDVNAKYVVSFTDESTGKNKDTSYVYTSLPETYNGEYEYFVIESIDDKKATLLCNSYRVNKKYNTKFTWRYTCEVTKGSLASYNRGETIELKSINDNEQDKAMGAVMKAQFIKSSINFDPYESIVRYGTSNHVFLIDKKQIVVTRNAEMYATFKVLKEVNE